jgi:uncharacterized protein (TIGR02284 family)
MGRPEPFTAESLDEVGSTLNQLIQICKDGEAGFASAAVAVEESALRQLFQSLSQQRSEFAAELELEVRRMAQDPVQSGHASAAVHRAWLDIKAGIVGRSDRQAISQLARAQDRSISAYQKALDSPLPQDLRLIVDRQLAQMTEAREQLGSLERSQGAAAGN